MDLNVMASKDWEDDTEDILETKTDEVDQMDVDYVAEELPFYTQMLVQSGASEEDISSFNEVIGLWIDLPPGLSPSVGDIAGQVFFGLVGLAIQVVVIYFISTQLRLSTVGDL